MNQTLKNKYDINNLIDKVNSSDFSSIKGIITGIFKIINNPESTALDLEGVIKLDPPLTAKVLKVANSAFFASKVQFNDLKESILWIGFDEVKDIALTQKLITIFMGNDTSEFSRTKLWKNSVANAILCQMIYRREFGERGENLYTAGLLHNIGLIIIDQFLHEEFIEILQTSKEKKINIFQAEKEVLNFTHADVGAVLGENWNFPASLISAIKFHHNPEDAIDDFHRLSSTLYISNFFCKSINMGYTDNQYETDDIKYNELLSQYKIETEALEIMQKDLYEKLKRMEEIGLISNGTK